MLLFGACSGLVAQTVTYPFDVVRRQMQVGGLCDAVCIDYETACPISQYCIKGYLAYLKLSVWLETVFEGDSTGHAITHVTCMQVQGLKHLKGTATQQQEGQQIRSTLQGLRMIIKQQGPKALFAGLSLNYIKVVPSTAIGFTIYDALKQYLGLPQHL